jgi:hypothetical protein
VKRRPAESGHALKTDCVRITDDKIILNHGEYHPQIFSPVYTGLRKMPPSALPEEREMSFRFIRITWLAISNTKL